MLYELQSLCTSCSRDWHDVQSCHAWQCSHLRSDMPCALAELIVRLSIDPYTSHTKISAAFAILA